MSKAEWGKKTIAEGGNYKKTGKPKEGHNLIRVLPGLGEDAPMEVYVTTHWGYAGNHPTDATKTRIRPFRCIEESRRVQGQRMITRPCGECNKYNSKLEEADAYEATLKAQKNPDGSPKYTKETLKAAMKSRRDWLQAHRPERRWYLNVKYKDGTFGDYKINHRHHRNGIKAKMKELAEMHGIDGIAPDQGVWFDIIRNGDGIDPPDVVEYEMETVDAEVNGRKVKVQQIVPAPLSDEDWEKATKECRDLTTLGGAVLTAEQIDALTKCSGDPDEVDAIFGDSKPAAAAKAPQPGLEPERDFEEEESLPATKMKPAEVKIEDNPRLAAILARKEAEVKAKAEAEAKAAAEAKVTQETQGKSEKSFEEMSDEEYLEFFNNKNAQA